MRKTIDEIKSELSNTSANASFRLLTQKEQGYIMGKAHPLYRKFFPRIKSYASPIPKHLKSFFAAFK